VIAVIANSFRPVTRRVAVCSRVGIFVSISDIEARLTHIAAPTVLIEAGGWRLLTDPTFDPPGQDDRFGWAPARAS